MLSLLTNLPKETLSTQLGYGAVLMLLGMCTVFCFLVILIFCTKAMSAVCKKISKKEKSASGSSAQKSVQSSIKAANDDAAIAAAIAAAYDKSKN